MSLKDSIICQDGHLLRPIKKKKDYYLNRTSLIFGRTHSGKTTILNEILYICKDYIPNVWVISRTHDLNDNFSKIIPKIFIKKNLNNDFLFTLLERQKGLSSIFKMVNDIKNLYSLFCKIASEKELNLYDKLSIIEENIIMSIKEKKDNNNYCNDINKIKSLTNKNKLKYMKKIIYQKQNNLNKKNLSKQEKNIIHYLYLNPNTLIVLDDCASSFKLWYKKCKKDKRSYKYGNPIKSLFYEGRWMHITLIITAQDDKEIDPELRKNALVTIFTTEESVLSSFSRTANSHPMYIKRQADIFSRAIFSDKNKNNYKKLVYIKIHGECPFRYTVASIYNNFKVGSINSWIYSEKIMKLKKKEEYNKYLI